MTQEKNCSPGASHHSHRKQSTFLTAFQIGARWQQRKHKGTRGLDRVVPAPRLVLGQRDQGCTTQR